VVIQLTSLRGSTRADQIDAATVRIDGEEHTEGTSVGVESIGTVPQPLEDVLRDISSQVAVTNDIQRNSGDSRGMLGIGGGHRLRFTFCDEPYDIGVTQGIEFVILRLFSRRGFHDVPVVLS
jgi:hypothetical protein